MGQYVNTTCEECGAKCCRYFCFEIDQPKEFDEFEDLRWFLLHEGISVHIDEGDWYISIDNRCKALTEDGHCRIYADRPLICRGYSMGNCDHTSGNYEYQELFQAPEDIERYARKVLGDEAYEAARRKAHAKLARKQAGGARKRRKPDPRRAKTAGTV